MGKREKSEKNIWLWALPVMLAVGLVPLIATAKLYKSELSSNNWFSNGSSFVDIFLYWKGQALILLAFIMVLMLIVYAVREGGGAKETSIQRRICVPELACLCCYLVFASLSALFSQYGSCALTGGYEQWEGLNVLLAYGVLTVYAYLVLDSERVVQYVVYSIIAGGFVMGLIGTFQYIGMDLFRSKLGYSIMSLMSESTMRFSFNFPEGWVYATLYNPNYVGSYAALILPVLVAAAMIEWKMISKVWTILAIVSACLMTVTLLGSQSLTGCVGVIAALLFLLLYRFPVLWRQLGWKKIAIGAGCAVLFILVAVWMFPKEVQFGMNKLFRPTRDYHITKKLASTTDGLEVTTVENEVFYVVVTGEIETPLLVKGADKRELPVEKDAEQNFYRIQDSRFSSFRLYPGTVTVKKKIYDTVKVDNPDINKSWTLAKVGESYQVYNAFGKLDFLQDIPAWGFEDCQHFGDKRGYIWSRTFPLLKKYMILGAGPDTFTQVFPNNDYVGKTNMNYDGVPVTKPHNMYLQIWVQTGFISLVSFLLLFFWYFVKSVKIYWKRPLQTISEKFGFAVLISLVGYMVTGLANDSSVTVAPVFWGMLGLGIALNRTVKNC